MDAPEDVDVPQHLLAPEAVEQLVAERQPRFIPLERYGPGADPTPPADSATGEAACLSATVLRSSRHASIVQAQRSVRFWQRGRTPHETIPAAQA